MPFSSSFLLNNLVVLSHCHYAKLYSFHYKYVLGVVGTSHAEDGTSGGLSATITLLAPNCRHGSEREMEKKTTKKQLKRSCSV